MIIVDRIIMVIPPLPLLQRYQDKEGGSPSFLRTRDSRKWSYGVQEWSMEYGVRRVGGEKATHRRIRPRFFRNGHEIIKRTFSVVVVRKVAPHLAVWSTLRRPFWVRFFCNSFFFFFPFFPPSPTRHRIPAIRLYRTVLPQFAMSMPALLTVSIGV